MEVKRMTNRKYRHSKLYKLQEFDGGISLLIPIVDDLDDETLRHHLKRAIEAEDYEYAACCREEINKRSSKTTKQ
jgi:hypothetical protein